MRLCGDRAKQDPTLTPAWVSGAAELPIFYSGCNGAFFGPRACGLGSVSIKRHGFAGLKGPANVTASFVSPADGTMRVTASGGVRVAVDGVGGTDRCTPIDGVEVPVVWTLPKRPNQKPLPPGYPLHDMVGGGVGVTFEIPEGGILYAWHV